MHLVSFTVNTPYKISIKSTKFSGNKISRQLDEHDTPIMHSLYVISAKNT